MDAYDPVGIKCLLKILISVNKRHRPESNLLNETILNCQPEAGYLKHFFFSLSLNPTFDSAHAEAMGGLPKTLGPINIPGNDKEYRKTGKLCN